jgi:NAD(P)-dependent dehydrogenase (short-subunit alcohol dehydrogenase family)
MIAKRSVENMPDLSGKTAIVTGANGGIGYEIARALASKQATTILACRNEEKGETAVHHINQEYPQAKLELMPLDLSSLTSIRLFAEEFSIRHERLDILINNAGIMAVPFRKTADGFESQFATNHLGHFALTGRLLDLITSTPQARVVTVSSGAHRFTDMDFDNLNAEKSYAPKRAYAQTKLANLLFTYELQGVFENAGVDTIAAAAHPGWTATNLRAHWRMLRILNPLMAQGPEMGALPILYAATAPDVPGGSYYGPDGWQELKGYPTKAQSSSSSYDEAAAARLRTISEDLTGVQYRGLIE